MKEEIIALLKQMVAIPSVNSTPGEKKIGEFIEGYIRSIPYFQKHPDYVFIRKLKNDPLERRNVIALIRGEKGSTDKTIICHGHTDTVGVEDFGDYEEAAFSMDRLLELFRNADLPQDVREDYESGEYLFGRGCCDMKGGDAVFLVMARHICERIEAFHGNLVLSFNPVEENQHTGIIEAIDVFEELQKTYGLRYILAINNDYICPMYPGDPVKYIYTGAVGKVLPCFYIKGMETHVGQCFNGFDASMVAAQLVDLIHLNPALCDAYNGEMTLPPSVLKCKDLKKQYNVQTIHEAFVYFNYFLHNASTQEVVQKMTTLAGQALARVGDKMNARYKSYQELTGKAYEPKVYETEVLTYGELFDRVKKNYDGDLQKKLDEETERLRGAGTDSREISMEITRLLTELSGIRHPVIVFFFAAPYCPHNTLKHEIPEEEACYRKLAEIAAEFGKQSNETYELNQFFPSLTDSSYLKIDDSDQSIACLKRNFAQYDKLYAVPLERMKKLNIPAVNFGCWGKDAHRWTERVHVPYSFEVLPRLITYTFEKLFHEEVIL